MTTPAIGIHTTEDAFILARYRCAEAIEHSTFDHAALAFDHIFFNKFNKTTGDINV